MSLLQALLLAVACLPSAASKQSTCDFDSGEDVALLQKGLHAESIDRSSGRKADPPAENNDEALKKLNDLAEVQQKAPSAGVSPEDAQAFGTSIAQTSACLVSSSCGKPAMAEHVLNMISTGLTMGGQPELAVISGLAEVLVGLFFPQAKKAGKPPLTLKAIGEVVSKSLTENEQATISHINMKVMRGSIESLMNQFGIYLALASNDTNGFQDFRSSLDTVQVTINGLVSDVSKGWVTTVRNMKDVKDLIPFQNQAARSEYYNVSNENCHGKCVQRFNDKKCIEDLGTVSKKWKSFENVAQKFIGISNAFALLISMANAVYKKFDEPPGPKLQVLLQGVLPVIKASVKVSEGLLSFEAHCADTFFNQFANSSGTNMPLTMSTDRDHKQCSDTVQFGYGWKVITPISLLVGKITPNHNRTKFGFSASGPVDTYKNNDGTSNDAGWTYNTIGNVAPSRSSLHMSEYSSHMWWYLQCQNALTKLTGIPAGHTAQFNLDDDNVDRYVAGSANLNQNADQRFVNEGASALCEFIWQEADVDRGAWTSSGEFDQTTFQVCARPQTCAVDECTSIFKSFAQSFGTENLE